MKILQVNKLYYPWIGGVETVVQDIAEHFNGKGDYIVENLVCVPKGKRREESVNGVAVHRAGSLGMALGMPLSVDFFMLFRKYANAASMIFLHHPFPLAFVAYWLFGKKKDVVVWYHSDIVRQKVFARFFYPFLLFALKRAKHIFVSNRRLVESSPVLSRFKGKCRVIYFGIETSKFAETEETKKHAAEIKKKYGIPLLLSVGRLVYYKGFSYLIEAMEGVPMHLLIVGSGPLKDELTEKIKERNLADRVTIVDSVEDLVPYYHACDAFVLPSCEPSEAFGIVQIEAMACGKPVINTALPTGVPEVTGNGKAGITVPLKDANAIRAAIEEMLRNPEAMEAYGFAAKLLVAERYTKEKFFAELEKFL